MKAALAEFLIVLPALISIVNPVSSAFIFRAVTAAYTHEDRLRLAREVATYSFLVMTVALLAGSAVLGFFGVSIGALRLAGGFVVAFNAWQLLTAPEEREARKQEQAAPAVDAGQIAFFPLTMPFTTGPGTISVTVALGAQRPPAGQGLLPFIGGAMGAILAMAAIVWIVFGAAERIGDRIGPAASRTITRLFAFLLICIGVQILVTGTEDVMRPFLLDTLRAAGVGTH